MGADLGRTVTAVEAGHASFSPNAADAIADALGCAEATARSHVHRATRQLRSRLAGGRQ